METIKTYDNYSIDSLYIRTPIDKVSNIDLEKIGKVLQVNENTGQVEDIKNRQHNHIENGLIKTSHSIIEYQLKGKKYKELQTFFTSKILTKGYFRGITNQNISYIYRKLQSYGIAKYSLQTFLESKTYDVDWKKDIPSLDVNTIIILEALKLKSKLDFKYINTLSDPRKKKSLGLLYGSRKGIANKNVQLKFYQKNIELATKSIQFYREYFHHKFMPETIRAEFNVKNQTRYKQMGMENRFTLQNCLDLDQSQINIMFNKAVSYHIINPMETKLKKQRTENTQAEELIEMLLCSPVNEDYYLGLQSQYIYAQKWVNNRVNEKSKKSRYLKKLESKYSDLINQNPKNLTPEKFILNTLKKLFY